MDLINKIAIVTGANSGIGLATALYFLEKGAKVVGGDLNDSTEVNLRNSTGLCLVRTNVSVEKEVDSLIQQAVDKHGRIDVLVNCAGIELAKKGTDTTEEEWDRLMDVNLKGVFLCSRAAIRQMRSTGGGVIVNVASELGLVGASNIAAYCASKGGVIQLTKAMAIDHASENIRINCICPGPIDTPLLNRIMASSSDPVEERQITAAKTLLNRLGKPQEIARVIGFLSSEDASYMTGSVVVVDGGLTAQ
jgi:NAD(P)-dependent dehydrogenase (short-subunit alcohol dehydrogenase family)